MATATKRSSKKAAPKPEVSELVLEAVFVEDFPDCCGIGVCENVQDNSMESLLARRVVARDDGKGIIFATTVGNSGYTATNKNLKAAGFERVKRFYNPNSGNNVVIWMAPTLKRSEVTIKEQDPSLCRKPGGRYGYCYNHHRLCN